MFYMSIKCLPFSVILLNDKYGKATKFTVISIQTSYDLSDLYYYGLVILYTFWNLAVYGVSCAMEIDKFHECTCIFAFSQTTIKILFIFVDLFFAPLRMDFVITMMETKFKFEMDTHQLKYQQKKLSFSLRLH